MRFLISGFSVAASITRSHTAKSLEARASFSVERLVALHGPCRVALLSPSRSERDYAGEQLVVHLAHQRQVARSGTLRYSAEPIRAYYTEPFR